MNDCVQNKYDRTGITSLIVQNYHINTHKIIKIIMRQKKDSFGLTKLL